MSDLVFTKFCTCWLENVYSVIISLKPDYMKLLNYFNQIPLPIIWASTGLFFGIFRAFFIFFANFIRTWSLLTNDVLRFHRAVLKTADSTGLNCIILTVVPITRRPIFPLEPSSRNLPRSTPRRNNDPNNKNFPACCATPPNFVCHWKNPKETVRGISSAKKVIFLHPCVNCTWNECGVLLIGLVRSEY